MSEGRDLGLDARITRKDFLNAALLGVGGMLISSAAPSWARGVDDQSRVDDWTGYGGVGDYARSSATGAMAQGQRATLQAMKAIGG